MRTPFKLDTGRFMRRNSTFADELLSNALARKVTVRMVYTWLKMLVHLERDNCEGILWGETSVSVRYWNGW